MRRLAFAFLATASLGLAAASAADLKPIYKAPPAPPVAAPTWTGFYVGVNAGAIINDTDYVVAPAGCFVTGICGGDPANNPLRTDAANLNGTAFTAGGQVGYNLQINQWLVGVETDINYSGINDTDSVNRPLAAPLVGNFAHTVNEKMDWFGTLRARVGWVPMSMPSLLLYATGGLAYGHVSSSANISFVNALGDTYAGSVSSTRTGWTAGGGAEWAFANGWSAKAEYLHIDLGSIGYTNACVSPTGFCTFFVPQVPAYTTNLDLRADVVRVGANYRFQH
jgi:outer membrane immunogenic protein